MTLRTGRWSVLVLLALAGCVGLTGCSGEDQPPESTVEGRVTLDGEPVTVGVVQLVNEEIGVGAKSDLNDEGRYYINTPFLTGEYQVAILPPPAPDPILGGDPPKGPFVVPRKYTAFDQSGLSVTLTEGSNEHNFDLTSK